MRVEGESVLSLGIGYRKNTGFEIFHNSLKVTWTEEFGFCLFSAVELNTNFCTWLFSFEGDGENELSILC